MGVPGSPRGFLPALSHPRSRENCPTDCGQKSRQALWWPQTGAGVLPEAPQGHSPRCRCPPRPSAGNKAVCPVIRDMRLSLAAEPGLPLPASVTPTVGTSSPTLRTGTLPEAWDSGRVEGGGKRFGRRLKSCRPSWKRERAVVSAWAPSDVLHCLGWRGSRAVVVRPQKGPGLHGPGGECHGCPLPCLSVSVCGWFGGEASGGPHTAGPREVRFPSPVAADPWQPRRTTVCVSHPEAAPPQVANVPTARSL